MEDNIVELNENNIEENGTHEVNMGTVYDMNKMLVSQLPKLSASKVRETLKDISKYIMSTKNNYYMLLNKDLGYYSLFHIQEPDNYKHSDNLAKEVRACIEEDLKADFISIEKTEDNLAYEIWVRMNETENKDNHVFYLFPYDSGLIEIKGE